MTNRRTTLELVALLIIPILLYYPVFYSEYLFTDEAVQLWLYKKGSPFQMFTYQGRYLTDKLFKFLFSNTYSAQDVTCIRIFSLCGWLLSIPVWYFILKSITRKERLPVWLPFLIVLYLICAPGFSISIGWASCLELFLANTTGLISGYIIYKGIREDNNRYHLSFASIAMATFFGLVSLFTYQNGFGCFLIPLMLHFLANPNHRRKLFIGVGCFFLIAVIYYALFKYQIKVLGSSQLDRTVPHFNPFNKLEFFFTKPLTSAFHLNYLVTETSIAGVAVSMTILALSITCYFIRMKTLEISARVKQIIWLLLLLAIGYIPSLIVKENYSSNRTLLALGVLVFIFLLYVFPAIIKSARWQTLSLVTISTVLIANAYYNFHFQFLKPVVNEYAVVRTAILENYSAATDTILVRQPTEDFNEKKYGITRSWDEFGVPSFFFNWVPEFFVKQVVFEKTNDRSKAEKLVIKKLANELILQDTVISGNKIFIDASRH